MSYLILLICSTLLMATVAHLYRQFHQTAKVRQTLHQARADKQLIGLHFLRGKNYQK